MLDKLDLAIDNYKAALSIEPNSGKIYLRMGRIFYEMEKYEEVVEHLEKGEVLLSYQ